MSYQNTKFFICKIMSKIDILKNYEILKSLVDNSRQYLVGDLKIPQKLNFIFDTNIEIGITDYSEYQSELPHTHSVAYEYQYMLSGHTFYLDIETNEEFEFKKGDFFKISPGFKYAQKSKKGTRILFIKVPPGNDKINLESDKFITDWLNEKVKTIRKDFTNDSNSPKPNSLKPATAVALFNENNELLLLKRRDSKNWTMPGGTLDFGENLTSCAVREVFEETGYKIEISEIIGTYTNPNTVVQYSDGEVRQEFTIVYSGNIISGTPKIDEESLELKWMKIDSINQLPLAPSQKTRIKDVVDYKKTNNQFLR